MNVFSLPLRSSLGRGVSCLAKSRNKRQLLQSTKVVVATARLLNVSVMLQPCWGYRSNMADLWVNGTWGGNLISCEGRCICLIQTLTWCSWYISQESFVEWFLLQLLALRVTGATGIAQFPLSIPFWSCQFSAAFGVNSGRWRQVGFLHCWFMMTHGFSMSRPLGHGQTSKGKLNK